MRVAGLGCSGYLGPHLFLRGRPDYRQQGPVPGPWGDNLTNPDPGKGMEKSALNPISGKNIVCGGKTKKICQNHDILAIFFLKIVSF